MLGAILFTSKQQRIALFSLQRCCISSL